MKGRSDENWIFWGVIIVSSVIWLPILTGLISSSDDNNHDCELEWVECTDDDKVSDCEIYEKEVITGPYWNETKDIKITLRKQVCR